MKQIAAVLVLLSTGCAADETLTLRFDALVGDAMAACGETFDGVGTTESQVTLSDLRIYLHDFRVVTADGAEVPLSLEQDGLWQVDDIVLLDFEDGANGCTTGNRPTNTLVRGTVPAGTEVTGVRFVMGVPEERNHLDVTTAPSPLNFPSMHWSWNAGYKFFRVDSRSNGMPDGWSVHIGSTGCEGDGRGNVTGCVQANRSEFELTDFDPEVDRIALDIGALLDESNVDTDGGGAPGCFSGFDDPECRAVFHGLGLSFAGEAPPSPQRLFRVAE